MRTCLDRSDAALHGARVLLVVLCCSISSGLRASTPSSLFEAGVTAYTAGDYEIASEAFSRAAQLMPSTGSYLNLGLSEWRRGRAGPAVLAWEKAVWLDPFENKAQGNLEFARKAAQLESPYLTWYEVASTWLPPNWWAWVTGLSLWTAVGAALLPGVFRSRRAAWHQAVAATGLAVFLLSLPAHFGVATRTRLGFILERDTPLRLTPTRDAQVLTRLASGEPVRALKSRKDYVFVRTLRSHGWVARKAFGAVVSNQAQ